MASTTAAEVSGWVGALVARGLAPSTATRALATLRSLLAFAVADARVQHNVAASVRKPTSGRARRYGQALTLDELRTLTAAGADPKVVQRVLGHATASMTMDLYGHLADGNPWQAARMVGDISGTSESLEEATENESDQEPV